LTIAARSIESSGINLPGQPATKHLKTTGSAAKHREQRSLVFRDGVSVWSACFIFAPR
jgi:hypothetical protein